MANGDILTRYRVPEVGGRGSYQPWEVTLLETVFFLKTNTIVTD